MRVKLAKEAPVPKLISWNIAGRVKARNAQLEWIASEHADVLALQEIARASDLQQRLFAISFKYFSSTKPRDGRNKLVAIASRKPLRRIWPFDVPYPERAISCLILLGRKEAELHCVHVPHGEKNGRAKVEFLEAVSSGISTRERPQLLVGDFNCPQCMEPEIVTWAQMQKDGGWRLQKTCEGIDGGRWDAAERRILCPKADMKDADKLLNGVATDTYFAKVKGGPNCFDHIIASKSIMPSKIRPVDTKLSDHAALVAEWVGR